MLRGIDITRAGMLRQQQFLDTTAHNVENVDTPGFKINRAALESGELPPPAGSPQATGTATPGLTALINVNRLFSQGAIRSTGVPTDMAIEGDGFFAVRQADGTPGYTRNGAFRTDSNGQLVDGGGRIVQPPVTVPNGAGELRVADDGTVSVLLADGRTRQSVGQIQLARFTNPNGLLAGADGIYTATAASGSAQTVTPGPNGSRIRGGALENSNTDLSEQMTNLMAAQRAYQLNTSAFRMEDEMLQNASELPQGG